MSQLPLFEVAPWEEFGPLVEGRSVCIHCQHEVAVTAPVRAVWLNCDSCGMQTAMFIYRSRRAIREC